MAKFKLLVGSHTRWEGPSKSNSQQVTYKAGVAGRDIIDLSPAEIATFAPHRIQPVGKFVPEEAVEGAATVETTHVPLVSDDVKLEGVLQGTVADITEYVSGLGSADEVKAVLKAEKKGQDRKGVHAAVEARLAALESQ